MDKVLWVVASTFNASIACSRWGWVHLLCTVGSLGPWSRLSKYLEEFKFWGPRLRNHIIFPGNQRWSCGHEKQKYKFKQSQHLSKIRQNTPKFNEGEASKIGYLYNSATSHCWDFIYSKRKLCRSTMWKKFYIRWEIVTRTLERGYKYVCTKSRNAELVS